MMLCEIWYLFLYAPIVCWVEIRMKQYYAESTSFGAAAYFVCGLPPLELVARPAVHFEDLPKYLCLRIGELAKGHQRIWSPMDSYKRRRLQPEYWFSVPLDRCLTTCAHPYLTLPYLRGGQVVTPAQHW